MRKFRITVEGRPYEVEIEEIGAESAAIAAPVTPAIAAPEAPKVVAAPAPAPKKVAVSGGTQLKSPMPGTILGLKVTDGTTVKKGQSILVLEAMKMENDIAANADGVITFSVAKGASVSTGDLLAVIA
jgi:biotin carboxyl carrier protein